MSNQKISLRSRKAVLSELPGAIEPPAVFSMALFP